MPSRQIVNCNVRLDGRIPLTSNRLFRAEVKLEVDERCEEAILAQTSKS